MLRQNYTHQSFRRRRLLLLAFLQCLDYECGYEEAEPLMSQVLDAEKGLVLECRDLPDGRPKTGCGIDESQIPGPTDLVCS